MLWLLFFYDIQGNKRKKIKGRRGVAFNKTQTCFSSVACLLSELGRHSEHKTEIILFRFQIQTPRKNWSELQ